LKLQGRFGHLMRSERKEEVEAIRQGVQENWQRVLKLCSQA